jgi:hypothetical protein
MRGGISRVDYAEAQGSGYEQAFRWRGILVVGDHTLEAHGLGVRDHSWGVRRIDGWERCWWTTMAVEDASVLFTGMNLLKDGRERSLGFRQDAAGVSVYPSLAVDVHDGDALWPAATVTFGSAGGDDLRVGAQLVTRLPMAYAEGSGQAFLSDDTLCTVTASDGTTGFAVVEHNRPLRHHELAELRGHTYSRELDDAYRDEARTRL